MVGRTRRTRKKSSEIVKKMEGDLVKWEDELAKEAEIAASMEESSSGGQFFSTRGGQLTWQDSPLPNNEVIVIILDHIFETIYYSGKFDPDTPQSPTAFALGRNQADLVWHENSDPEFAGMLCSESEVCDWGSADTGKGKLARETRRLAIVPAGQFNRNGDFDFIEDAAHYETAAVGYMRLPVTSVKGFANFVRQVAGAIKRPPYGIITRIAVIPDARTQFKVTFEALGKVPDELMGVITKRRKEIMETIDFPYQQDTENLQESKTPSRKKSVKRGRRKY